MKVLFLEKIHEEAVRVFSGAGCKVTSPSDSLSEVQFAQEIRGASILGIRSKTRITKAVLEAAPELLVIGAFCIGVDQIDCRSCSERGIAIFNDPHSNTRSVAELTLGETIMLVRRVFCSSTNLHNGVWRKTDKDCHEVRGMTLGIIGYGKIGSQLSELAEAIGMKVIFCDVAEVLSRGNARKYTFSELLKTADIVTLHVDGKPKNINFFGDEEFRMMKQRTFFLNLSRGFVVDYQALANHLKSGKLKGAAIDVFPNEPGDGKLFLSPLQNLPNVILTPHIGGSTEEAQQRIGQLVSSHIISYLETGDTTMCVNLPPCKLERTEGTHRLVHIHQNIPGILLAVSKIFAERGINIERQIYDTKGTVGYAIFDINQGWSPQLIQQLKTIPNTIRFRILY